MLVKALVSVPKTCLFIYLAAFVYIQYASRAGAEVMAWRSSPHNLLVNEHTSEQAWKDHCVVRQMLLWIPFSSFERAQRFVLR